MPVPPLPPAAGANLANGWMLRPGASVIEVTPYQFEYGRGSFVFSATNARVGRALCLQRAVSG